MSKKTTPFKWTPELIQFLKDNYPIKGKNWCCEKLGLKEHQVRYKASILKLRIDTQSEFYKNVKSKMAETNRGKKRPKQSKVMKDLWTSGKITNPPKKERTCVYCGSVFFWDNSKNRRKTCSDECYKNLIKNLWKDRDHPKGMMGKTHSKEEKRNMSERSKKLWADKSSKLNSLEHRQSLSIRNSKLHEKGILGNKNSYSRCKRGWFDDGKKKYFMRSSWELNYATYLNFLIEAKDIKDWEYEVDIFRFNNIKQGVVSYKPDFKIYNNDDTIEYHEVKGWMDSKSKTKIKRMKKYYPEIKLIIIGQKEYKSIKSKNFLYRGWI
jgi:hypothetical protein